MGDAGRELATMRCLKLGLVSLIWRNFGSSGFLTMLPHTVASVLRHVTTLASLVRQGRSCTSAGYSPSMSSSAVLPSSSCAGGGQVSSKQAHVHTCTRVCREWDGEGPRTLI